MKIGILTFHAQINYGGVLQCFALQEALKSMGHEPVVIDRWFSEDNSALNPYVSNTIKSKLRDYIGKLLNTGDADRQKRFTKTRAFINDYLNLTPYSFCQWKDTPKELGIDAIIVGSDQVWNATWQDPKAFLLEGAPQIPAISYAASFGMRKIPEEMYQRYKDGFNRFTSISVREMEGKGLVENMGVQATLVVDPSLLLSSESWFKGLNLNIWVDKNKSYISKHIVCYFISENINTAIPVLESYAKKHDCRVEILVQSYSSPSITKDFKEIVCKAFKINKRVNIKLDADPRDFIRLFSQADAIISDSFHALMFASIFDKNIRIIKPSDKMRANMFARIEEFAEEFVIGNIISENLPEALINLNKKIFYNKKKLDISKEQSFDWLKNNISKIETSCL